jgi:branched-chain amino acid transport system substrate-binding protein
MITRVSCALGPCVAFVLNCTIAAGATYDRGASDSEIVLGQTIPYSGPVSALGVTGRANRAYFDSVNEKGGVNGRKVRLISLDDGYSPPKTIEATRRLVEQDGVLAMTGSLGSSPQLAVRSYLNTKKVPQLFIMSATDRWLDPANFPWSMHFSSGYGSVQAANAAFISKLGGNKKVAILYQNDDFGKELSKAFQKAAKGYANITIVKEISYEATDPSVNSQLLTLAESKADVLLSATTPKFSAQVISGIREIGWSPLTMVDTSSSSIETVLKPAGLQAAIGVYSNTDFKDPSDPRWAKDPGMIEYFRVMAKFAPDVNPVDINALIGMALGQAIEAALLQAGDDLTTKNLMAQATNLKGVSLPLLLPGIRMQTATDDYEPLKQQQIIKFDGTTWQPVGDIWDPNSGVK